jgi:hypothetical protein
MSLNLTSTSLPYNTTMPSNLANFPQLITQNLPWFFPLILLIGFIWADYALSKSAPEISGTKSFVIVALAYSSLSYLVVAGGLTTSAMFFLFEIIALAGFFFETLITSGF